MYDIIIVGAGPAGLSAAIYGVRAGKSVLLLEGQNYGGQIINTPEIENYPGIKNISGFEFATNLYEQAISLGAKLEYEKVTGIREEKDYRVVITETKEYESRTVILATGAKYRPLGLPNEEALIGAGVSYCATCDGAFFRGRDVAVAGGGNTAIEDAMFLSNYCSKVYIIHRRDQFRAEKRLVEAISQKENVEFILDSTIEELIAEDVLKGVRVKNKHTGEEKVLTVSALFVAIGQMPQNHIFSNLIDVDHGGYIKATEDCKTNLEGVFTAGDCRTKSVRQLATAAGDGAVAALAACEFLG